MRTTTRMALALALLAPASAGCAKTQTETLTTTTARVQTTTTAAPLTDAQIVGALLATNQSEIAEADIVLEKSNDPLVVAFATRMSNDHTEGVTKVQSLANRRAIVPGASRLSQQVEQHTRQQLDEFRLRSGRDLDREFVDHQIAAHQELLSTIDRELLPATHDPEIREVLTDTRSVANAHLTQARAVAEQLPR